MTPVETALCRQAIDTGEFKIGMFPLREERKEPVVEFVLPERMTADAAAVPVALLDLIMMVYAGGRERTEGEFARLLERADLQLADVTALSSGPRVLKATPR